MSSEIVENRIRWIDSAKGIAMLCVVLGHMGDLTIGPLEMKFVFSFHLTVFFLLSGYTLKTRKIDAAYINSKFKRLMVPYFITCFCVMLMDIFNNAICWRDGSVETITKSIGYNLNRSFFASGTVTRFGDIDVGGRIGAVWFLPAIFFAILITQWVLNYTENHIKRWLIMVSIALIGYISSWFLWLPFGIQPGMVAGIFILFGYYMKQYHLLERLKLRHYILLLAIFIIGIKEDYVGTYFASNSYKDLLISFLVALAGSLLIIKLSSYTCRSRYLNFVGRHSMLFLCTHLFALETLGGHMWKIVSYFGFSDNLGGWMVYLEHIIFTTVAALVILKIQRTAGIFSARRIEQKREKRDISVDIMKGILIISMLIGHFDIDPTLRKIIYSCHMIAFVFLSGYFFKQPASMKKSLIKLMKAFLLPYAGFCIVDLLLQAGSLTKGTLLHELKTYLLGMSFSQKGFADVSSFGPVYFILLLFAIRIIYLILYRVFPKERIRLEVVIVLSLAGLWLGNHGFWLPWSLDCALYALIFYCIGIYFKKYNIIELFRKHFISYFVLSCVWAFMIYEASMELAIRQYMPYGLVILGAVSGTILIYMLSSFIRSSRAGY